MVHSAPRSPAVPFIGALLLGCMLLLSGCVYRMAVQQGNYLDARQVVQVKEGMTRAQIRFLLGTPMLPDAFNRDRWDYLYTLNLGDGSDVTRQRLTVYFEDDKVSRIENAGAPTELPADATAAPAAPATPNPPATPGT
jgi:outer membrane protein assembly factor BamE